MMRRMDEGNATMRVEVRTMGFGSGDLGPEDVHGLGPLGGGRSTSPEAVVLPPGAHWAKERDADPWKNEFGENEQSGAISLWFAV